MTSAARVIRDMTISDYHADKAFSKSGLKVLLDKTPAHYFHQYRTPGIIKPKASPQQVFGQALHTIVLEEDKFKAAYVEGPAINKNTIRYKTFKVEAAAAGKIIIDAPDMARLTEMRHALYSHPDAIEFLPRGESEILVEASFFWEEKLADSIVSCKCRPDMLVHGSTLRAGDLKSTRSAKKEDFMWDVFKYGYDIQDASYTSGVNKLEVEIVKDFTFIAIESEPPYCIALYNLTEPYRQIGYMRYRQALQIASECEKSGRWPGYPSSLQPLEPPQKLIRDYSLQPSQEENDEPEENFIIA